MKEKVLVLCKTYPHPSESYLELTCVAGIKEDGSLVRLYPIPFRHLNGDQQFKKWQWIEVDTVIAKNDSRRESRKIENIASIKLLNTITTEQNWFARKNAIKHGRQFESYDDLIESWKQEYISLAFLKPARIVGLEISAEKNPNWTSDQLAILKGETKQNAFEFQDEAIIKNNSQILEKPPFIFRYIYEYQHQGETRQQKTIIKDWEIFALYRNCVQSHGENWQVPFRKKIMDEFSQKDMIFLMGNLGHAPKQWMIISLIYPPKPNKAQQDLF